ncbi:methyl-CpG-binding domain-containing protein 5-like [Tasmannia lanceolata]|uniref:methyl-CpG-binding domain-containing protein 5-like n=1 Tax=Tasmannia lanceolata TaxID=3420 RepID=UPI0040628B26
MDSDSTPSSRELLPVKRELLPVKREIPSERLLESDAPEDDSINTLMPPRTAKDPVGEGVITASEGPDWLPAGWTMKEKIRTSGKKDKLYVDPVSNRRFSSKKKVLDFLKIEAVQSPGPKPKAEESMDGHTSSGSSRLHCSPSTMEFDYDDVPEKVTWVLTDPAQGSWTPFLSEGKVSESTKKEWEVAFERRSCGLD